MSLAAFLGAMPWRLDDPSLLVHPAFEILACIAGFVLLIRRKRSHVDPVPPDARMMVTTAALIGAAVGAKLLHHLNAPSQWHLLAEQPHLIVTGRTVVGAIVGGTLAVEIVKARRGIRVRTGDVYALPLCLGLAVGRIGCLLAGVHDGTHGSPTTSVLGVDLGDGVPRHPTALYEIVFALLLGGGLVLIERGKPPQGKIWSLFLLSYMLWRFLVDFLKPGERLAGLTAIQAAALATALWAGWTLLPRPRGEAEMA